MDLWQALEQRRSIRKYRADAVPGETLVKLADAARLAPNNGNAQPWDFVFVTDGKLKHEVVSCILEANRHYWGKARTDAMEGEKLDRAVSVYAEMENAPALVLVCLHTRTYRMHQEYHLWNDAWNHQSLGAAFENFILAAVNEGLGTCWIGTAAWQQVVLKSLLGIPEDIQVIAVSPVGYPAESPKARPRIPVEEIVHFNGWQQKG